MRYTRKTEPYLLISPTRTANPKPSHTHAMETKGQNREVVYSEFKDLSWRIEVPTSSMFDKNVEQEPRFSCNVTYTKGDEEQEKWVTLSHESAAALLQDIEGAMFSLRTPHCKRIGRIVK